jgi:hypothetical protein
MENTTNDNFITDEQLLILLDSKEAGKSFPDALTAIGGAAFSHDETQILKSLWNMHGDLMRTTQNISPHKALLTRIIEQSPAISRGNVTAHTDLGYTEYSAKGTFISLSNNLHSIMQMNWKIAAPIAVVVIAVVVVMSMGGKEAGQLAVNNVEVTEVTAAPTAPTGNDTSAAAAMKAAPAPVSGNVNDLVASLTSEGDLDLALIDGSAEDAALVTADNQSVNDFTTAYDETTF